MTFSRRERSFPLIAPTTQVSRWRLRMSSLTFFRAAMTAWFWRMISIFIFREHFDIGLEVAGKIVHPVEKEAVGTGVIHVRDNTPYGGVCQVGIGSIMKS
jgi:hypothetical protein